MAREGRGGVGCEGPEAGKRGERGGERLLTPVAPCTGIAAGRVPITPEEAAARQQRREGSGQDVQGLDFSDLGAMELLGGGG